MKFIKEDIKLNQFKPAYLLYGTEAYLKTLYKNKLKVAMVGEGDSMNYSHFDGKGIDVPEVIGIANTLPFFADHRVIVIENSGFFKNASDLADYMKNIPESTHFIFVEDEVDKRNRMYKAVKDVGRISEMNGMDETNLKIWVASLLRKDNKKITEKTLVYFLNKTGSDMENLQTEVEKLVCYAMDRDIITEADVDAICTTQLENKIFQMIDFIANKRQQQALALYYDLLTLKEKPMSILFLITRHFNILLQIKEMKRIGIATSAMSQKAGVPPFAVNKYLAQTNNFTTPVLKEALTTCADIEENVKTGRLIDKIGVELLIVKYSTK
ncbi:DNA polymerase III subunit delta [Anaerosporobacter faecicola]|uniref:DNA polymerase III subunit delta n=1 Tax=Anaerosporobacter faecicola TaxID=2718714 RepID=UPI00143C9E0A|nr:DNA polymerase III subunit delta [Anaerosporobacter faecicola]